MLKRRIITVWLLSAFTLPSYGQETFPVNGVFDRREELFAFINANIVTGPGALIKGGTLVIRKGIIVAAGIGAPVPKGSVVLDLRGAYIYPSFIDLHSDYGMPAQRKTPREPGPPQMISSTKGAYGWNEAIRPEVNAFEEFAADTGKGKSLRSIGFGAVLTHFNDGICRGTGALVTLGSERENELVLTDAASAHFSFSKGSSRQNYPSSLMGSIALIRQTYLDAAWYRTTKEKTDYNISLEAWNGLIPLPAIFEVDNNLSVLRADKIGDEFGKQYIIKGAGDEYQIIPDIKATSAPLIITLNFPKPYEVEDPYQALQVSLRDMKHWELAPANAGMLEKAGIPFALSSADLKNKKDFWPNLRKAIAHGLSEEEALRALTVTPAMLIGADDRLGTLQPGKIASFLITSGSLFDEKTVIFQNWISGKPYHLNDYAEDLRGKYLLSVGRQGDFTLSVTGAPVKPAAAIIINDTTKLPASFSHVRDIITLSFSPEKKAKENVIRLTGVRTAEGFEGQGQLADGMWVAWKAVYTGPAEEEKEQKKDAPPETGPVIYPFTAYGREKLPLPETVVIRNATVWTNEREGILQNTDILVQNGLIAAAGKALKVPAGTIEVDGTGKHLTPGIIDEHSHIAIYHGVNEGSQASTAEVRIGDVVTNTDVNIYRQLAGGVTAAQLLHGSANPIGGQSALIKLKWGYAPEKMKIPGADGFIKFALGENVKQSNWGDNNTTRFPQTRMGVEQVYYDHFTRAREYGLALASRKPLRRDLEMDALLEILTGLRFVTCHSYRQSEINMLMHVADSMGFRINTFTHILEGYKVADKMKAHGAGASTFSDWWSYKYEVIEAIPYNGAILDKMGVVTAFNSDDAEMGRRLNQEAAKAVKYGGLSEESALKLVTLNPAKLLHIDHRTGSILAGKDADLVLWSDNPLSIYAVCEKTWVEGVRFYDRDEDLLLREWIAKERARLIQKMIAAKKGGTRTSKGGSAEQILYDCDDTEVL